MQPLSYFFFFRPTIAAALIAVGLVTSAPILETPALVQAQGLVATGLTADAPTLGASALSQGQSLTVAELDLSAPSLGVPTVSQAGTGAPIGLITTNPDLGRPTASQAQSLTAIGLITTSATVGTSAVAQSQSGAFGLTTLAPILRSPALSQLQSLAAVGLSIGTPTLDVPVQDLGIPFICAPDISIDKPIDGSTISPSADLRLQITLSRDASDIDPHTGLLTDYTNCSATFVIYRHGSKTELSTLTLGSGISRAINEADSQVFVVLWPQAEVAVAARSLHYRFTVITADGALVSGDNSKPEYSGNFMIARY